MGTLLVGTDLGVDCADTLDAAAAFARLQGHRLVVAHVVPHALPHRPLFPHLHLPDSLASLDLQAAASGALESLLASSPGLSGAEPRVVRDDDVATGLLALADAEDATLIAVGGGAPGRRWLFGTTAERIVTHARIPVLVVRPFATSPAVLAATDLSDPSVPAVRAAVEIASQRNTSLTLMHCVEPPAPAAFAYSAVGAPSVALFTQLTEPLVNAARAQLEALVANSPNVEIRVEVAHAADAIVRAADDGSFGLIVMGTRGRTGLERLLLGSVARRVVESAPCSVLVVRLT